MKPVKADLLQMVEYGGCSSKLSPGQLEEILKFIPLPDDRNILVNTETGDDAGVYRLNDEMALVLTTDFFPPVCSDPFDFGQIAAANSISDIYAMGGDPILALNIMMFPSEKLGTEVLGAILRGGAEKAMEAGVRIIGGHTIDDYPPKYGLAVVGLVHPSGIITNTGAKPGDRLILTKPLGTGVILAAARHGLADQADVDEVLTLMKQLNRAGCEIMRKHEIKGGTDVTGFGLAGHALKMAVGSGVTIEINLERLPLLRNSYRYVDEACIPGAAFRNLEFAEGSLLLDAGIDYNLKMLACDAQTSGGLLMCVPEVKTAGVLADLRKAGITSSEVIGSVRKKEDKHLVFTR